MYYLLSVGLGSLSMLVVLGWRAYSHDVYDDFENGVTEEYDVRDH